MTLKNKIFIFGLIILLLGLQNPSQAQDDLREEVRQNLSQLLPEAPILPDVQIHRKTHPERIVFTQVKLAGGQADVDAFAKASPHVANAQEIDKTAMALAEYNRIGNSFNMHNEKAPIVVHTSVIADEYSSLQNMIIFDEFDEKTYFQYGFYDHMVGIVPENVKRFSRLELKKPSADRFFRILNNNTKILAEFILLPTFSDNKEPLNINEENIWLMFTRVAEFRLWSTGEKPQLLWYHRAPWYEPEENIDIKDLYSRP